MITLRCSRALPGAGPRPCRQGQGAGRPAVAGGDPARVRPAGKVNRLSIPISRIRGHPLSEPAPRHLPCSWPLRHRTGAARGSAPFMGTDATYEHGGLV
jgi:hypothetical protein